MFNITLNIKYFKKRLRALSYVKHVDLEAKLRNYVKQQSYQIKIFLKNNIFCKIILGKL